jgi:hypothetical protein
VVPGAGGGDPAAGGAREQALLDEERLDDVLDGVDLLPHRDGEGGQPDGAAGEGGAQRLEDAVVEAVEAALVDLEQVEGGAGDRDGDDAVGADLGVVADALEEAVGDPGRPAAAPGDLVGAVVVEGDLEDGRGAGDDALEVGLAVEVEPRGEAEAVAQRAGDQPGPGGRADEGERRQRQADRPRARPLADRRCRAGSPPSPGRGSPRRRAASGGSRR